VGKESLVDPECDGELVSGPRRSPLLSARFDRALTWAAQMHVAQVRKGTAIPYISHLLAVCSIVLEYGGDEDEAIAGLLHDVVEDQGGVIARERLRILFGERVVGIVDGCTDTDQQPKPPWRARKDAYIAHLAAASPSVLLVALADKLHNARSILRDYRQHGATVWTRFSADRDDQLWYYRALVTAFQAPGIHPALVGELASAVAELEAATGD
jgi:GTP pyrophosphokinase